LLVSGGGHPGGREGALREAYAEIHRLVEEDPENPTYLDSLAAVSAHYAGMLDEHSIEESKRVAAEGAATAQRLADMYPDRPLYEKNVAACYTILASIKASEGDHAAAAELQVRCIEVHARLMAHFPDVPRHRVDWVSHRQSLAQRWVTLGRFEDARGELKECQQVCESLHEGFPGEVDIQAQLHNALWRRGELEFYHGDATEAAKCYTRCFACLEDRLREAPDYEPHRKLLASYLRECPIETLRNPDRAAELELPPRAVAAQ
jgi:tetratricopeptide (TPR) repeat protein